MDVDTVDSGLDERQGDCILRSPSPASKVHGECCRWLREENEGKLAQSILELRCGTLTTATA